jgi:hypothetical protein
MSHTRGPWEVVGEDDGVPFDNGVRIDSPDGPVAFGVLECDADLVAAAPDMLAALRLIANKQATGIGDFSVAELCRKIIAKATGGE